MNADKRQNKGKPLSGRHWHRNKDQHKCKAVGSNSSNICLDQEVSHSQVLKQRRMQNIQIKTAD